MDILGAFASGQLKFKTSNKEMFDIAVNAFNKYSDYGLSKISNREQVRDHLNYFLQSIQIVSGNEGGFDAINTYDSAGITVGFVQFARPDIEVYKVLSNFNKPLADEVKNTFGTGDKYLDNKSVLARLNKTLLLKVQQAIVTPQGIDSQFKSLIERFYDKVYKQFLGIQFLDEPDKEVSKYKIYALAFMLDVGINQGTGVSRTGSGSGNIRQIKVQGQLPTEGSFVNYYVKNHYLRDERRTFWEGIIGKYFKKGTIYT